MVRFSSIKGTPIPLPTHCGPGAVPFVRTNVPQTLMVGSFLHFYVMFDCNLSLVGRNLQPRIWENHKSLQPLPDTWWLIRRRGKFGGAERQPLRCRYRYRRIPSYSKCLLWTVHSPSILRTSPILWCCKRFGRTRIYLVCPRSDGKYAFR